MPVANIAQGKPLWPYSEQGRIVDLDEIIFYYLIIIFTFIIAIYNIFYYYFNYIVFIQTNYMALIIKYYKP